MADPFQRTTDSGGRFGQLLRSRRTVTFSAIEELFAHAVADALGKAARLVPNLHWFEVVHTAGHVQDGSVDGWHVVVRAGLSEEDLMAGA